MYIYILAVGLAVLTIISYLAFRGDIIHPGFVVPLVFLFSTICAIYNVATWGIDLLPQTIGIILSGAVLYFFVSFIVYYLIALSKPPKRKYHEIKEIEVSPPLIVALSVLEGFVTILYLREVIKITGGSMSNLSSIAASLGRYKELTHFTQASEGVGGIVAQLYQFISVIGLLFVYVAISQFVSKKKISINYIIPIIIYAVSILVSGNRLSLLRMVFFAMVVYFVLWHRSKGWKKPVNLKIVLYLAVIIVIVLAAFVGLRTVVGKTGRTVEVDPLYYISEYAGGSIQLFDLFIRSPGFPSDIFGYRTSYYINNFVGRITNNPALDYLFAYEFRRSNGINIGNVYTGFRAFYEDFGYLGMCVCIVIHAALFSMLYAVIRKRSISKQIIGYDLPLILFARMSYGYFFMSINYYSDFFSPNFIKIIIFFIVAIPIMEIRIHRGKLSFKNHSNQILSF